MEKQNHEDLLRGRVSIIDYEYPSITLFLLGGLLSLLCRGLLRRHGFFTPFHPPWIDLLEKLHEAGHTGNMVAVSQIRRGHSCPRLSHSRDFKKATSSWLLSSWLLSS